MRMTQARNEEDAQQLREIVIQLRETKDYKIDELTRQVRDLQNYTTQLQGRIRIRDMEDYELIDLGISEEFINKINHLKDFHYIDEYAEGDLEWRPAFRSDTTVGLEVYQGQWIKGTMIKQGFGRRGWTHIKPGHSPVKNVLE